MYITRIKINDYKSYFKTPIIELKKGINLIVGKNNVGKTAILECLGGDITDSPHLNQDRKPRTKSKVSRKNKPVLVELYSTKLELLNLIEDKSFNGDLYFYHDLRNSKIQIGYGQINEFEKSWFYLEADVISTNDGEHEHYMEVPISEEYVINTYLNLIDTGIKITYLLPTSQTIFYDVNKKSIPKSGNIPTVCISNILTEPRVSFQESVSAEYEICNLVTKEFIETRIFKFDIHRTVKSSSHVNGENKLLPNCDNLATVLVYLQGDRGLFDKYVNLVKEVFSEIRDISISQANGAEIKIWMPQSTREDLAIPLSACGTGIGQVMAMFYLLIQSDESQVIIIDEPNSFLHPSACRKLIEIFKRFPQHQYIISTHSPEIISRAESNNTLLLTINEQGQTEVQKIDRASQQGLQTILNEVGVKLSDVYGYDKVLWVEGPTEELCFPEIIQDLIGASTVNVPVLKVHDTGSFEKKHINISLDIYYRLSNGTALLPPAIAFIFDKEGRKETELEAFKVAAKRKGVKMLFLERRLYENYLLDVDAILSILESSAKEYGWEEVISKETIKDFLIENKFKNKYWDNKKPSQEQLTNWKNDIHAAKLLEDLFNNLSGSKLLYRKTTHSVELTKWLIKNKPTELDELKELLSKFYKPI